MANAREKMLIRVAANIDELRRNMADGTATINTTAAAMARLSTSLQGDKLLASAQNIVAAVHNIGGATKLTEAEQARVNATLDKAIQKYTALGKEAPAAMRQLYDATKPIEPAMQSLSARLAALGPTFQQVASGMQATGMSLSAAITAPLVALGAFSVKAASDFESAFAGVRKTVNASKPELDALSVAFRKLSTEIPVSAVALSNIGESAGQLGIPTGKILEFTRVMADLGATTNLSAEEAATSIAKIQNIFGAAGVDTARFGAALVELGNAGASTERDITEMATRIAGAGHVIGLTHQQVLGIASALSDVGIEAEMGGSAISKVMINMSAAVEKGGADLALFSKIAGVNFRKAFQEDAAGALALFIAGLKETERTGMSTLGALDALGIAEVRMRDTLLRASGAGDLLTQSLDRSAKAWADNTALTKEAEQRYITTASQVKILWGLFTDLGITVGNTLLPMIRATIGVFKEWIPVLKQAGEAFAGLPVPIQATAVGLAMMAAAAGPALIVLGSLVGAFGKVAVLFPAIIAGLVAISNTVPVLTARLWLMHAATGATGAALGTLALGGAAIAGLVALGAAAFQAAKGFANLWEASQQGRLWEALTAKDDDNFVRRWLGLSEAVKEAGKDIELTGQQAGTAKPQLLVFGGATDEATKAAKAAAEAAQKFRESVTQLTIGTHDYAVMEDQAGMAVGRTRSAMQGYVSLMPTVVSSLHGITLAGIESQAAWAGVPTLFGHIVGSIQVGVEKASVAFSTLDDILESIPQSMEEGIKAGSVFGQSLKAGLMDVLATIPQTIAQAFTGGGGMLGAAQAIGTQFGSMIGQKIGQALSAVGEASKFLGPLGAAIGSLAGPLIGMFADLLDHTKEDIERMGASLGESFSDGLVAQMEKDADRVGDEVAGMLLNLSARIKEAGGVMEFGFENATARAHDLFSMIETGKLSVKDAGAVFDDVFGQLADALIKSGDLASQTFLDLLRLNEQFGTNAQSVTDFISSQMSRLGGAVAGMLGPLTAAYSGMNERLADTKKAAEEAHVAVKKLAFEGKRGTDEYVKALENERQAYEDLTDIIAQQKDGARASAAEFDRMGALALIAFNGAIANGASYTEALAMVGGGLDALIGLQKSLGMTSDNVAINELIRQQQMVQGNEALFTSVSGLSQGMLALSSVGMLNADTFKLMEQQGFTTFTRLQAAAEANGGTQIDALRPMIPFLQEVLQGHELYGLEIDANTQLMIDQARELGLLKEPALSATDVMKQGFSGVITKLQELIDQIANRLAPAIGGVGSAAQGAAGATRIAAGEMVKSWKEVEDAAAAAAGASPSGVELYQMRVAEAAIDTALFGDIASRAFDGVRQRVEEVGWAVGAAVDDMDALLKRRLSLDQLLDTVTELGQREGIKAELAGLNARIGPRTYRTSELPSSVESGPRIGGGDGDGARLSSGGSSSIGSVSGGGEMTLHLIVNGEDYGSVKDGDTVTLTSLRRNERGMRTRTRETLGID